MLLFPGAPFSYQGYYALVGMAGMLSGVLKAPLSAIFLIMEITGGYDVLASVVLVSVLSTTLSGFLEPLSFYHKDLIRKGLLLRARTDARVLSEIRVVELLEKDCRVVAPHMKLGDFVRLVAESKRNYFPVENRDKEFLGMVRLDTVRSFLFDRMLYDSVLIEEIMETDIPIIHPDDSLTDVIQMMDSKSAFSLPVVEHGRFLGLISKATLLDHYRREMAAQEES
jgi:CIC family chloride channel protein